MSCTSLSSRGRNAPGKRQTFYYTALLRLGRALGKEVVLRAGGVGPLTRPISRRMVRSALHGAAVTVRDRASKRLLTELGPEGGVTVVPDTALSLPPADRDRVAHLLRRYGLTAGKFAVLALREESSLLLPLPRDLTPVLIPFFPREDRAICLAFQRRLPRAVLMEGLSPSEILGVIGEAAAVLGMRLHALIFAERMGVPYRAVGDNPKLTGYPKSDALPSAKAG